MRQLKKFFAVPEGEKVTERHLRRVLVSFVCSLLLCMGCLIGTTWAWFTVSVASENNVIQMGIFSLGIVVTDESGQEVSPGIDGIYRLPDGRYTVTVRNHGDVKGFCRITADGTDYDIILGPGAMSRSTVSASFTFGLTVSSEESIVLSASGFWGSPVQSDNETLAANGLSVIKERGADNETVSESTETTGASES